MASRVDWADWCEGTLASAITASATSATVTAQTVNDSAVSWPTGAHRVVFMRKTRKGLYAEKMDVTSATQSGSTVTLTIGTRAMSATDGTSFAAGTGRAWPAGTRVFISIDVHDKEQLPYKDLQNTFAGQIRFSGTDHAGLRLTSLTTAQRDALTPANGDIIYNSTTGVINFREGGAWNTNASGSTVADASTTVAGKVEEATVAEQGTAAATGGTGARLFVANANLVKTSSGAGDENKLAVLDSSGNFAAGFLPTTAVTKGGTGLTTLTTAYGVVCAGTTATGNLQNAGAGTSGQFLKSNGASALPSFTALTTTHACVYASGTSAAAVGASSTAENNIGTHTYTIPASDLVNGVVYEFQAGGTRDWVSGTLTMRLKLGSTAIATVSFTPATAGDFFLTGYIYGTAAAGASVAVFGNLTFDVNGEATPYTDWGSASVATNGTLVLQISAQFSASDSAHHVTMKNAHITKISSTAF